MITFKEFGRYGRLGNMMFQYAALYGCAKKTGFKAVLPAQPSLYYGNSWRWPYNGTISFAVSSQLSFSQTYSEPKYAFNSNLWSIRDNTNLHGYFQSEKYFDFCRDEILREFDTGVRFREGSFKQREHEHSIAIHIRRGDFLNNPTIHPAIPVEWYERMIQKYKTSDVRAVFIFTDDDRLGSELSKKYTYVRSSEQNEIDLMSKCRTVIIANSSFSWWGAYLNNRPDRQIIAPYPWFGSGGPHDFEDVYCKGWVKENWRLVG